MQKTITKEAEDQKHDDFLCGRIEEYLDRNRQTIGKILFSTWKFQVSVDLYKILAENTRIKMTCGNEVFDHKEILQLFSLTSEKIHKTVSFALV